MVTFSDSIDKESAAFIGFEDRLEHYFYLSKYSLMSRITQTKK